MQRLTRLEQQLLVGERLLRVFAGEEVEVGLADRVGRVVEPQARRQSTTDAHEPALGVLEVDLIGDVLHQRVEQVAIVEQLIDERPQGAHVVVHPNLIGLGEPSGITLCGAFGRSGLARNLLAEADPWELT